MHTCAGGYYRNGNCNRKKVTTIADLNLHLYLEIKKKCLKQKTWSLNTDTEDEK